MSSFYPPPLNKNEEKFEGVAAFIDSTRERARTQVTQTPSRSFFPRTSNPLRHLDRYHVNQLL
jgi:hypothetical protein